MKCKQCGSDIPDKTKTMKIKELGIEVEVRIHDKNKTLSDINIPKGWRLLTISEICFLHNKYKKKLDLADTWEFVKQPLEINKNKVARFYADSGYADLDCDRYSSVSYSVLGVRFCRDLKVGAK